MPRRRASFSGSYSDFMRGHALGNPFVGVLGGEQSGAADVAAVGGFGGGNPFGDVNGEAQCSSTNPFLVAVAPKQPSAASQSISGAAARIADNIAVDQRVVQVHLEHSRARKALEEKEQELDA